MDAASGRGASTAAASTRKAGAEAASAHGVGAAVTSARGIGAAAASAHRVGEAPASAHRVGAAASTHRGGAAAASAHGADNAAASAEGAGTSPDHSHEHGRVQWLLLAPVIALLVFTPPALGANGAPTGGSARPAAVSEIPEMREFPPLPAEPAPTLTLIEVMNRANLDSTHSLDGREITLSGFILRAEHGDGLDLARVAISCCVADARYVRLHLTALPQPLPEDTWIEVRGTVVPNSAPTDPDLTPTLTVHDFRLIERPENSYERIR
ncbi:TIGR03943 family putative permease subunit [Nocardia puris]|nr:TIGR03943 family protein [Nocardia puris]